MPPCKAVGTFAPPTMQVIHETRYPHNRSMPNAPRAARRSSSPMSKAASSAWSRPPISPKDPLRAVLAEHLRTGKSGMEETAEGRVFLTVYVPAPQLVITGAVHISQALAPIGKLLGYDVTIVDPRTAFASPGALSRRESDRANGRTRRCRRSTSTATPRSSRSPTIRRSTIRRCCTRCRAIASISARSAREKPTPGASSGSRRRA